MAFDSFTSSSKQTATARNRAFEALYREHAAELVKVATERLGGRAYDAEDVVQDAFLELLESKNPPANPVSYLKAAVRRRCAGVR